MKKMTKLVAGALTAAAIFFGTNVASAQSTPKSAWRFGIGVDGLAPVGKLHDVSNVGLGITPRLQYGISDALALTLTSGYYNFFGKNINAAGGVNSGYKSKSFGMVPVKAGVKAFVSKNFYLDGEVGAAFETSHFGDYEGRVGQNPKQTKLIASPGIGWANQTWDIGARYENFSGQSTNFGTLGLRIAYGFGL
ncbi:hypothetical protein ACFQZI_07510 [Mucilaginibacter lutimaris]|uniref:Outer membrane protein beta-barrel domain-containing protein n=1 Tax=Mucilaginibacter lutimaris TaxID=931629 RepID=A0ABW2ZER9_9SPHI